MPLANTTTIAGSVRLSFSPAVRSLRCFSFSFHLRSAHKLCIHYAQYNQLLAEFALSLFLSSIYACGTFTTTAAAAAVDSLRHFSFGLFRCVHASRKWIDRIAQAECERNVNRMGIKCDRSETACVRFAHRHRYRCRRRRRRRHRHRCHSCRLHAGIEQTFEFSSALDINSAGCEFRSF